jgi:hypothetical protein
MINGSQLAQRPQCPYAKKVQLEPHLSVEELYTRYRRSVKLVDRSHYQIIWLLASGYTPLAVSQVTGYSHIWIYQLAASTLQPIGGFSLKGSTFVESRSTSSTQRPTTSANNHCLLLTA